MKIKNIILLLSLGCNIYLWQRPVPMNKLLNKINSDQVSVRQSAISTCPKVKEKIVYQCPDKKIARSQKKTSQENFDQPINLPNENDMEKFHQLWSEKSSEFLEYQLRLPLDKVAELSTLRQQRSQEIDELLSSRFKQKAEEGGNEAAPIILDAEDTIALGKINLKYQRKLLELMGEENMREYQSFKQNFNQAHANTYQFIDF